jgi:hypothetical protein
VITRARRAIEAAIERLRGKSYSPRRHGGHREELLGGAQTFARRAFPFFSVSSVPPWLILFFHHRDTESTEKNYWAEPKTSPEGHSLFLCVLCASVVNLVFSPQRHRGHREELLGKAQTLARTAFPFSLCPLCLRGQSCFFTTETQRAQRRITGRSPKLRPKGIPFFSVSSVSLWSILFFHHRDTESTEKNYWAEPKTCPKGIAAGTQARHGPACAGVTKKCAG